MLTAFCAAFCTARSRLIVFDGAGVGFTSLSTAVSTPFWLTLTTRQPASPSSSSSTAFLTWATISGAKASSVGNRSAMGVITTPGRSAPGRVSSAMDTLSQSSLRSVIRSIGEVCALACSARDAAFIVSS
ncbi:Uncharacterised protein [Mycobacteroides abscessus subsp. abscessus]|nr:Uncharacterised protein [Mycobacteroides abscessus subsp. abscessus]